MFTKYYKKIINSAAANEVDNNLKMFVVLIFC